MLFVHGWGHQAAVGDDHLDGFRQVLSSLAKDLDGRQVVGVYLGWRGLSLKGWLYPFSFPDRETLARRIGSDSSDFTKLMDSLNEEVRTVKRHGTDVVAVSVGHSLGGKMLFESLEAQLEAWTKTGESHIPDELKRFGDLVVLVNPASDANDYKQFVTYNKVHAPYPAPILVAISSETDEVVGTIYHRGQWFVDFFKPKSTDPDETVGLGWKFDQVTHFLCLKEPRSASGVCHDPGLKTDVPQVFETSELRPRHGETVNGPFIVIRANTDLIPKHSEIFGDDFRKFLVQYVSRRAKGVTRTNEAETTSSPTAAAVRDR